MLLPKAPLIAAQHLGLTSPLLPTYAGTPPPSAHSADGEMTPPPAPASGWPPAAQRPCEGAEGSQLWEKGASSTSTPTCHHVPSCSSSELATSMAAASPVEPALLLSPAPAPFSLFPSPTGSLRSPAQAPQQLLTGPIHHCRQQPGTSRALAAVRCWSQARLRGTCTCSKHDAHQRDTLVVSAAVGRQVAQQSSPSSVRDAALNTRGRMRKDRAFP